MDEQRAKAGLPGIWQGLRPWQRAAFPALIGAILVSLLVLAFHGGGEEQFSPLFTGLEARDAGEIAARLDELGVPYELLGDGGTLLVPAGQVRSLRLQLAGEGLPKSDVVGFEIMDSTRLGATDFDRRMQYLRALQGELTRTIEQIEGVEEARVHINLPEESLFLQEEKPASAAILLQLGPGVRLRAEQVRGIVHLVASSVKDLAPEQVTILDQQGRPLGGTGEEGLAGDSTSNLALQAAFQQDLERRVQSLLDQVLGPGNAVARVTAQLNFDRRTVERQTFEPIAGDQGLLREIEELQERFAGQGTGASPAGVPGTDSNLPTYLSSAAGGDSSSEYEKNQATRHFELNEEREQVIEVPGQVERLSVAVVVNEVLTPEDQQRISDVVAAAIGLDPVRRDQVTVTGLPFTAAAGEEEAEPAAPGGEGSPRPDAVPATQWAIYGAAALLVLLAAVWLLTRRGRRLRRRREELQAELLQARSTPAQGSPEQLVAELLGTGEREGGRNGHENGHRTGTLQRPVNPQRERVLALARESPEDVAQVIRTWLAEE